MWYNMQNVNPRDSAMNTKEIKIEKSAGNFLKAFKVFAWISTFVGVALAVRFWWVYLPKGLFYMNNPLYEAPVAVAIAKAALILRFPISAIAAVLMAWDLLRLRRKICDLPRRSFIFLIVNIILLFIYFQLLYGPGRLLVHLKLP